MKTTAVRLYGKEDLRIEEFELPAPRDDEILAEVVSDSLCMSSYKAAKQGSDHKRVPKDVAARPVIIGHEFSGRLLEIGSKWKGRFKEGSKFSIQPALNYKGSLDAPGYSFRHIGGDATHVLIPNEVMEMNCLLEYSGEAFFPASLSEPLSCIVGAFHASYHVPQGTYVHEMGIRERGSLVLLGAAGPMGLASADYAIKADRKPRLLVVTDIDSVRIARAKELLPPSEAVKFGVELVYLNTKDLAKPEDELLRLNGGKGYDDVFVFAPVRQVVELGDRLLAYDGCLNFFSGPTDPAFSAGFNFYNVHYGSTHLTGTSGGNTDDMKEALRLMSEGRLDPSGMITHVGGLTAVPETTLHLPSIPGGKKLIYTHLDLALTAIEDFAEKGRTDPLFARLAELVAARKGLWCAEAERYLLENGPKLKN